MKDTPLGYAAGLIMGAAFGVCATFAWYGRPSSLIDSAPAPEAAPIMESWPEEPPEPADVLEDGQIRIWRPGHWETYEPTITPKPLPDDPAV